MSDRHSRKSRPDPSASDHRAQARALRDAQDRAVAVDALKAIIRLNGRYGLMDAKDIARVALNNISRS